MTDIPARPREIGRLAFVSGDVPEGNRIGPSISVVRVEHPTGRRSALLRMGTPDVVISDAKACRELARALVDIAREIDRNEGQR